MGYLTELSNLAAPLQFRFVNDYWMPIARGAHPDGHLESLTAFAQYSEPFYAECRAFGRLREASHEGLALRCFGYVLLSEENEASLKNTFKDMWLSFSGDCHNEFLDDDLSLRARFLGRGGKLPPIRGILKEFGQAPAYEDLRSKDFETMLRLTVSLHQLGIVRLDMDPKQFINGKLADFSIAVTTPHFMLNPELNPHLASDHTSSIEFEAFRLSLGDYWQLDESVGDFNDETTHNRDPHRPAVQHTIRFHGIPGSRAFPRRPLRSKAHRDAFYTHADPRSYDWRARTAHARPKAGGSSNSRKRRKRAGAGGGNAGGAGEAKTCARIRRVPPRWTYSCDGERMDVLRSGVVGLSSLAFEFKSGLFFPTRSPCI